MAFRATANSVRSGLAKGSYKQANQDFMGFADALSAGLVRSDQAKMQEDMEIRREKRAEARRVKAAADAAEKKQKKQAKLATLFLGTQSDDVKNSPTAKSQVMTLIQEGGISSLSSLTDYMDKNATFTPPTTEMKPVSAMEKAPPFRIEGDLKGSGYTSLDATRLAEKYPNSTAGRTSKQMLESGLNPQQVGEDLGEEEITVDTGFSFGPKPVLLTNNDIKEDNWQGLLWQANQESNLENIALIEGIANASGWVNILGQKTKEDLVGMTLEDLIEQKTSYNDSLTEENLKTVNAIIETKKASKENSKWFSTLEGLLEKDINFLTQAAAVYKPDSIAGKAISEHLKKRIPMETVLKAQDIDLTGILKEDVDFYDRWLITATGPEFGTLEGAAKVQQVMLLKAAALEKARLGDLADEKALSIKVQGLNAWYAENGYFILDGDPRQPIKKPSSGEMAKFENLWTAATTAAKDPEVWKDVDKIKGMDADTLQMVVNAGLLPADSEELEMVKLALGERITQDEKKSASELGNFKGENFKSVTEMDTWLASRGGQSVFTSQEDTDAFIATRAILFTKEEDIASQELKNKSVNLYDQAAKIFLQGLDPSIQGTEKIEKLAEWEKGWRASLKTVDKIDPTTYTSANYAQDLIKYGQLSTSTDAAEKAEGEAWMKNTKPLIEASLQAITQLDDEAKVKAIMDLGVSEDMARGLVSGTIVTGKDAFQNPVIIDKGQGSVTQMSVEDNAADVLRTDVPLTLSTDSGDILITPEDKQAALAELGGLGLNISNLNDFSAGFGIEGVVSKYINFFTEPLGATFNKDSQEAATTFKTLKTVTVLQLVTALPGIRDSMSLKNQLGTLLSNPQTFTGTKPSVLREMKAVQSFINSALATQQKNVSGKNINTTQRSKSNVSINALEGLSKIYDTAITKMSGGKAEAKQPIDDSVFVTPDSSSSSQGNMTKQQKIDEIIRLESAKGVN